MNSIIDDITQGAANTAVGGWGDKDSNDDEKTPDQQTQALPDNERDVFTGHNDQTGPADDNKPAAQSVGQQMQEMGMVPAGFSTKTNVWSPGSPMPPHSTSSTPGGQTNYRYSWQE